MVLSVNAPRIGGVFLVEGGGGWARFVLSVFLAVSVISA